MIFVRPYPLFTAATSMLQKHLCSCALWLKKEKEEGNVPGRLEGERQGEREEKGEKVPATLARQLEFSGA